jgi:hypothetical protein
LLHPADFGGEFAIPVLLAPALVQMCVPLCTLSGIETNVAENENIFPGALACRG